MAFSSYNPVTTAIYFAGILLYSMFVQNPVISCLSFLGAVLFCAFFTTGRRMARDAVFYLTLAVLITATNPFFSHNGVTTLFYFNGNPVTLEAYLYGAGISLMLITVLIWCKAFSFVMTGDRAVYLFSKTAPALSLVLSAALRDIPALKRQGRKIRDAQKAMGVYASDSYSDRLRASLRVFSALVGWSLENAVETGKAMQARGYGAKKRTYYSVYGFHKKDAVFLTVFCLLFAGVLCGIFTGQTAFSYYPALVIPPLSYRTAAVYTAFSLAAFLPAMIEGRDRLLWLSYRSKI